MDLKKEIYLNNKVYIAKLTTSDFGAYDQQLFVKYYEPTVEVGGEITDGTTTFSLTSEQKYVKSQSPISQSFSAVTIGDYVEAGNRATAYVNVMETRITEAMNALRLLDTTTNSETNKTVVI